MYDGDVSEASGYTLQQVVLSSACKGSPTKADLARDRVRADVDTDTTGTVRCICHRAQLQYAAPRRATRHGRILHRGWTPRGLRTQRTTE